MYIGSFVVPLLYTMYRSSIDPAVKQAITQVKERFEALDRRGKAAGIMLVILLLGCVVVHVWNFHTVPQCLTLTPSTPQVPHEQD